APTAASAAVREAACRGPARTRGPGAAATEAAATAATATGPAERRPAVRPGPGHPADRPAMARPDPVPAGRPRPRGLPILRSTSGPPRLRHRTAGVQDIWASRPRESVPCAGERTPPSAPRLRDLGGRTCGKTPARRANSLVRGLSPAED